MYQSHQSSSGGSKTLDESGICLLSLDGGGVRGLSSLYILQSIMHRLNGERNKMGLPDVKPCDIFDLIGGTSTGGLIAIMLGRLEMSVEECIKAYKDLMASIFTPIHRSTLNFKFEVQPQFDSDNLREAIGRTIENSKMNISRNTEFNIGRTGCRVFVCAKTTQVNSLAILRSYNTDKYPDDRMTICDAAMATTAAPKLFKPAQINDIGYVDGALGANNPVGIVEIEAIDIWCPGNKELKPLVKCFISIGTGKQNTHEIEENALRLLTKTVLGITLETEETVNRFMARWGDHYESGQYFRFNVDRGLQGVKIAEYKAADIIHAATRSYLEDQQVATHMRSLVANLRLKKKLANRQLQSTIQPYMSRRVPPYLNKRPYLQDKDRNKARLEGTCQWFINHHLFQGWKEQRGPAFLWVSADPGCGKSVLAKSLVDEILVEPPNIICYFFFKEDFESQRRLDYAICCLLHQLFSQRRELLTDEISEKLEKEGDMICESFIKLWNLLIEASSALISEQVVCVLDAFDECEEAGRLDLTQALTKLYGPSQVGHHNLKFLVTSRYYGHSRWGFRELKMKARQIHLSGEGQDIVEQMSSEINIVIRARVNELGVQRSLSSKQQENIIEALTSQENRTYLWVHLIFEFLEETPVLAEGLQKTLRELPVSVNNAYERILSNTKNAVTARILLQIIVAAETQLTEDEMKIALAMKSEPKSFTELEIRGEPGVAFDFLKELCGLIVMRDSKVYLLHQTVREFLQCKNNHKKRLSTTDIWKNSFSLKEAHGVLAEICLRYLVMEGSDENETRASFAAYAATNWTVHYAKTGLGQRQKLANLVGRLLTDNGNRKRWLAIRWTEQPNKGPRNFFTKGMASVIN